MFGFDWDAPLSEADRDALVERVGAFVDKRGLNVPAVLFLEMHKPLGYLAGQSLILGSGFLAPFFGPKNIQQIAKLLESKECLEKLIQRLEQGRDSHSAAPDNISGATEA